MVSILDNETKMNGESRGRQVRVNRANAINMKRELALTRLLELLALQAGTATVSAISVTIPPEAESRRLEFSIEE